MVGATAGTGGDVTPGIGMPGVGYGALGARTSTGALVRAGTGTSGLVAVLTNLTVTNVLARADHGSTT